MKIINAKKELSTIENNFRDKTTEIDISEGRDNYKKLIELSFDAIEKISILANECEHPGVFKTLSEFIRNTSEINEKMINLHKVKEEIKKLENNDSSPDDKVNKLVQNNYFTSEELAKKFLGNH